VRRATQVASRALNDFERERTIDKFVSSLPVRLDETLPKLVESRQ
jgi:hypothetical protein